MFGRATAARCAVTASMVLVAGGGVAAAAPAPVGPDLVTNGSFEQPDIPTGTWGIFAIPGWLHAPRPGTTSTGIEIMDHNFGAPAPGAGDQFAELDSDGPSRVSQVVATEPGGDYRVELLFSPRPRTSAAQNHFTVSAAGALREIGPLAGNPSLGVPQTSWQPIALDFVATGSSTEVVLLDLGPEEAPGNGIGAYVDQVVVRALNSPPDCGAVAADASTLWPPNGKLRTVQLSGAMDPDGDAVDLAVTGVTQDEPVGSKPDAAAAGTPDAVRLRAQRDGSGDGRVYVIAFTATDAAGAACSGSVAVSVPHDQRGLAAVDSGQAYDAFGS